MIYTEKEFKQELDSIWMDAKEISVGDYCLDIKKRGYAIETMIEEDALMFLGMNPSFRKGTPYPESGKEYVFYPLPQNEKDKYFGKAYTIAKDRKAYFCHHDLLYVRETSQKYVIDSYMDNKEFYDKQLALTKNIIERAHPKMIVIINAKACEVFKSLFDFEHNHTWDVKLGVDIINIAGRMTPVIFSGMLTGSNPLDNGSYFSLRWHVGHICDNWPGGIVF